MNRVYPKPKAVFFDWDGTLVDSFEFLHAAHNHTRGMLGIEPFSLEVFRGYFGQPREKLYAELYGKENIEAAKGHFETYVRANHMTGVKALPGAEDVLKVLADLGVPCGVVTNKKGPLVEAEIRNFGWDRYFSATVGAGEAEEDKPSSKPLILAREKAGLEMIDFQDIWFVGDTDNDVLCALGAGSKMILVALQREAAGLLEKYDIYLHKNNCKELAQFLLQYAAKPVKQ